MSGRHKRGADMIAERKNRDGNTPMVSTSIPNTSPRTSSRHDGGIKTSVTVRRGSFKSILPFAVPAQRPSNHVLGSEAAILTRLILGGTWKMNPEGH